MGFTCINCKLYNEVKSKTCAYCEAEFDKLENSRYETAQTHLYPQVINAIKIVVETKVDTTSAQPNAGPRLKIALDELKTHMLSEISDKLTEAKDFLKK